MQVQTTNYYSQLTDRVDLYLDSDGQLRIDGQLVITARPLGERLLLVSEGGNQYCIPRAAYVRVYQEAAEPSFQHSEG